LNFFVFHQLISDPFERLARIDHVVDQISLNSSMVSISISIQMFSTPTNMNNDLFIIEVTRKFVITNKVIILVILILYNWNGNVICLYNLINFIVKMISNSRLEFDRLNTKEFITLIFDLLICESAFLETENSESLIFLINNLFSFNDLFSGSLSLNTEILLKFLLLFVEFFLPLFEFFFSHSLVSFGFFSLCLIFKFVLLQLVFDSFKFSFVFVLLNFSLIFSLFFI
jgi:hypothetical protein